MFVSQGEDFERAAFVGCSTIGGEVLQQGPVIFDSDSSTLTARRNTFSFKLLCDIMDNVEVLEYDYTGMIHSFGQRVFLPSGIKQYYDEYRPVRVQREFLLSSTKKYHDMYRGVCIHKFGKMERDLFVESGVGVYYEMKDGTRKLLGSIGGSSHHYTTINNVKVYIHALMLFCLCPAAWEKYKANDELVVNHQRIPELGSTYYETDPRLLELVQARDNTLHFRFVRRWGLWGVPVSALAVNDLDKRFTLIASGCGVDIQDTWKTPVDYGDSGLHEVFKQYCESLYRGVVNHRYK